MPTSIRNKINLKPTQVMVLGFAILILFGTFLLSLPAATYRKGSISVIDALFTATSAVCVTGLSVFDIQDTFTHFGQFTILFLLQAGGLGFMTITTLILMLLRRKITLKERLLIQESVGEFTLKGLVRLIQQIAAVTFFVELIGASFLATRLIPKFGLRTGLYRSIFTSISAFCNAGFDVNGSFSSFTKYQNDFVVNLTIMALVVIGGLGFSVLLDIFRKHRFNRLTSHAKLVLVSTGILLLVGTVAFLLLEFDNPDTMGHLSWPKRVLAAMFQSVTCRTAGFSTMDQNNLTLASKFLSMVLMFIGAAPGGTGGGVKVTTFSVIIMMVGTLMTGREDVLVGKKKVPRETVMRALAIVVASLALIVVVTMVLTITEGDSNSAASFENLMFETVSAFGTVGLSAGVTPNLTSLSKVVLVLTMFAGRVGPLTILLSITARQKKSVLNIKYPEARIMVG